MSESVDARLGLARISSEPWAKMYHEDVVDLINQRDAAQLQRDARYGDPGLELLGKIQEACPEAGIASGLMLGSEILLREFSAMKLQLAEEQKLKQGYYDEAQKGWTKFRAAELQIQEALKSCPWATHTKTHTEPKHCVAALASLLDQKAKEMAQEALEKQKVSNSPRPRCGGCGAYLIDWRCVECDGVGGPRA